MSRRCIYLSDDLDLKRISLARWETDSLVLAIAIRHQGKEILSLEHFIDLRTFKGTITAFKEIPWNSYLII